MKYYARALATPNIAVVKYWGKRDERLMLPTNSSLSFTMDEQLKTMTEVEFSRDFKKDRLVLGGKMLAGKEIEGAEKVLDFARENFDVKMHAKIVSNNYFPTAAGLASSASGYAALAFAINEALQLGLSGRELSILARLGSGSACRSVFGGFVEWRKGSKKDGSDSYAVQVASENHWPELRNVIAIVDQGNKAVSSRAGMRRTVGTSQLFKERLKAIDEKIVRMKKAVLKKDFDSFATLTMQESDDLHAVMADTKPAIIYLNEISRKIINAVNQLNSNEKIAAYTFDAGPNAHVYALEENIPKVKKMLTKVGGVINILVCRIGSGPRML